jgi:8-oxo-dGTP diphosphatase
MSQKMTQQTMQLTLVEQAAAAATDKREVVRAAGGVVYRNTDDGGVEVAVIHRPAYDDWSLPKGKLKPEEALEGAALREVFEETGQRGIIARTLGTIEYVDRRGRDKVVWYWLMRSLGGTFKPLPEVDRMKWMLVVDAMTKLSYDHDQEILARAEL